MLSVAFPVVPLVRNSILVSCAGKDRISDLLNAIRGTAGTSPTNRSFRRPEEFAILRVNRIFVTLIVENGERQRLEALSRRFNKKPKNFCFERVRVLRNRKVKSLNQSLERFCSRNIGRRSFANDFYQHPLPAFSIEFAVKDFLPGAKIKFSFGDGYHHFASHESAFKVSVSVVFRSVVLVL